LTRFKKKIEKKEKMENRFYLYMKEKRRNEKNV
jgi:hypothetical protein